MPDRPVKSLRTRIAIVVGGSMCLLLAASLTIYGIVTERSFGQLQDDITKDRIQRVARGINQMAKGKIRLVGDNAQWDETFDFINGKNPDFLARNFAPSTDTSGQDFILVLGADRKLLGSAQPQNEKQPYAVPDGLDVSAIVLSALVGPEAHAGLCIVGNQVLLLASCPVIPSNRDKASNGWLIFGQFFTPERTEDLLLISGAESIAVHPAISSSPPTFQQTTIDGGLLGALIGFYETASQWNPRTDIPKATLLLPALTGSQQVVVDIGVVFSVYKQALHTRTWIVLGSILCGIAVLAMGLLAVESNVMAPLASLDRQISKMAGREGSGELLRVNRNDEIGRLADSANRLLESIRAGLRRTEEHHRLVDSILESAAEGIIAYAAVRSAGGAIEDFRVMECNRAAERICLVQKGGLTGKTMLTLFPQLEGSDAFKRFAQVTTDRRRQVFEEAYERDDLPPAWMRISVSPWEDGVVITFDDVTDRKSQEKELSESYAEIDRFNAAMIGREERIIEIKREVNNLRSQLGLEPAYEENES